MRLSAQLDSGSGVSLIAGAGGGQVEWISRCRRRSYRAGVHSSGLGWVVGVWS